MAQVFAIFLAFGGVFWLDFGGECSGVIYIFVGKPMGGYNN